MMYINPKVLGLILLVLLTGALVYWATYERFETNPPAPDTAQTQ